MSHIHVNLIHMNMNHLNMNTKHHRLFWWWSAIDNTITDHNRKDSMSGATLGRNKATFSLPNGPSQGHQIPKRPFSGPPIYHRRSKFVVQCFKVTF